MLLNSCYFDDAGDAHIAGWFWAVIIIVALFIFIGVMLSIASGASSAKSTSPELKPGYKVAELINAGKYMGGHTSIDRLIERCFLLVTDTDIEIYQKEYDFEQPKYFASIPIKCISDIQIEDDSTIDKKITLGRVFLVGVFALAWRKNKKKEAAYLSIMWNDGKYTHNTIFGFENENAFQRANTARNKLIQGTRK